jgi:hypothetical protein
MSGWKSGNTCYHLAQNLLSSSLLSKNIKIRLYRPIILLIVFVWAWNMVAHIEAQGVLG